MAAPAPNVFADGKSRKLVLGSSFKSSYTAFHTANYDFKPASVDKQREGILEIGGGNEVTISLPHVPESKSAGTVYRGSKKPVQKECVLIYDNTTGEFTLERIASQIRVKKTRDSGNGNFSSNPTLHTAPLPRIGKPFPGKHSKPSKVSKKPLKGLTVEMGGTTSGFDPTEKPPNTKLVSDDNLNSSSSSSDSDSDSESNSSNDEKGQQPPDLTSIFGSNLHDDLHLSDTGSDSD